MKNLLLIAGAIAVGAYLFSSTTPKAEAETRKGSWTPAFFTGDDCDGTPAKVSGSTARLAWDGSNHVTIAVPAKARWRRGEGTDVVIHGDTADLERIRLEKGTIKVCGEVEEEIDIVLPGRTFEKLTIAGAGELSMKDVDQAALELNIAGAGKLDATGTSERLKVSIAGAGDIDVGKLTTKRLDVNIAGAGGAEASASENADVTIVGAGNVKLLTRPAHHDFNVIGAGDIKMPDNT